MDHDLLNKFGLSAQSANSESLESPNKPQNRNLGSYGGNGEQNDRYNSFQREALKGNLTETQGVKMADPTREEIDAKLAAVEARIETRLVGIDGKLDRIVDQIGVMNDGVKEAKDTSVRALEAVNSMKWHTLATVLVEGI